MVGSSLLKINQHENKWCCADETSTEVYICKIHSSRNKSPLHFSWYVKLPIIHELKPFGCDIYSIKKTNNKLDNITQ